MDADEEKYQIRNRVRILLDRVGMVGETGVITEFHYFPSGTLVVIELDGRREAVIIREIDIEPVSAPGVEPDSEYAQDAGLQ